MGRVLHVAVSSGCALLQPLLACDACRLMMANTYDSEHRIYAQFHNLKELARELRLINEGQVAGQWAHEK